jgi:hypothetical protein
MTQMILIKLNQYSASPQPLAPYKFIANMSTKNIPDPIVKMSILTYNSIMIVCALHAQSGTLSVQNFITNGIAIYVCLCQIIITESCLYSRGNYTN